MIKQPVRRRYPPDSLPTRRSGAANDNRSGRGPANDNRAPRGPKGRQLAARSLRLGGNLLRLNPHFRLATDALSVWDYLANGSGYNMDGWTRTQHCEGKSDNIMNINRAPFPCIEASMNRQSWEEGLNDWDYVPQFRRATVRFSDSVRDHPTDPDRVLSVGSSTWTYRWSSSEPAPSMPKKSQAIALPSNAAQGTWALSTYPELAPPLQAPAFPRARPWARPNTYGLNSSGWYQPQPRLQRARRRRAMVDNNWSWSFEDGPETVGAPKRHLLLPPQDTRLRKEKEGKVKAPAFVVEALKYIGPATEMIDLVEALYDALPEEYRPRYEDTPYEKMHTTTQEKFAALYQNFDKVNLYDALYNILSMEIEDRIIGTFGKMGAEASKRQGLSQGGGFNSALRPIRKYMFEYNPSEGVDNPDE